MTSLSIEKQTLQEPKSSHRCNIPLQLRSSQKHRLRHHHALARLAKSRRSFRPPRIGQVATSGRCDTIRSIRQHAYSPSQVRSPVRRQPVAECGGVVDRRLEPHLASKRRAHRPQLEAAAARKTSEPGCGAYGPPGSADSQGTASSHINVTPAASPLIASDKQADALSNFGFVRSE